MKSFSKQKLLNDHGSANTAVYPIQSMNKFAFDSLLTIKKTKTNSVSSVSSVSNLNDLQNLRKRDEQCVKWKRLFSIYPNRLFCCCLMLIIIFGLLLAVSIIVPTVLLTSKATTTLRKTQPPTFLYTSGSNLSGSNNTTQTVIQKSTTNTISSTPTVSTSSSSTIITSSSISSRSTTSSSSSSTTDISSTTSSSTISSSTSSTSSTITMTSSTTVSTITVTTTTPVATVTITSNICTSNWSGIQMFGHCTNCSVIPFYYGFVTNFTAIGITTRIVLGLRPQNGYFVCDDISVQSVIAPGVELLVNGGFETSDLTGWSYCNQNNVSINGGVKANSSNFTYLGFTYYARSGSYYYVGGSNISTDYLSQSFSTTIGQTYTVRTWSLYTGNGPLGSADLFVGL